MRPVLRVDLEIARDDEPTGRSRNDASKRNESTTHVGIVEAPAVPTQEIVQIVQIRTIRTILAGSDGETPIQRRVPMEPAPSRKRRDFAPIPLARSVQFTPSKEALDA
jgi:hypothetical protein